LFADLKLFRSTTLFELAPRLDVFISLIDWIAWFFDWKGFSVLILNWIVPVPSID
jgi:hypothetical protein